MNTPFWQTTPPSAAAECLPCCAAGAAGCCLTMPTFLVDQYPPNGLYDNLTQAEQRLADWSAGCYAETYGIEGASTSKDSSFTSGVLAAESSRFFSVGQTPMDKVLMRVYLTALDGISVVYNLSSTYGGSTGPSQYIVTVYADDQRTVIDSVFSSSAISGTLIVTIPSDGFYYIYAEILQAHDAGTATTSITLSCTGGDSLSPCSVRAAYQDGSGGALFVKTEGCPDCGPDCVIECASQQTSDCSFPPPRNGSDCCTLDAEIPCIDPPGSGHVVQTAQARLYLTGLTIGLSYVATIYFCQFSLAGDFIGTSSTTISFTATSTEERTAYYDVPAASFMTDYWCACGCDLLLAA